jgi:hypothetical protein
VPSMSSPTTTPPVFNVVANHRATSVTRRRHPQFLALGAARCAAFLLAVHHCQMPWRACPHRRGSTGLLGCRRLGVQPRLWLATKLSHLRAEPPWGQRLQGRTNAGQDDGRPTLTDRSSETQSFR